MRKSELTSLLESPAQIKVDQIPALQEVLSEYPYFTSAQLLLAKAFHQSENLNFEKQLRLSAAYAADRRMLHDLIHSENSIIAEAIESQEADKQEIESKEVVVESNEQIEEEKLSSDSETEDNAFIETQILTSAINSSIMLEVSGDDDELLPPDFHKKAEEDQIDEIEQQNAVQFDDQTAHSFGDWLKHFGGGKPETLSGIDPAKAKELRSISEQAKSIQKKAEFFSASKMAKLSVQESNDLVTETLAQVYEAQGKFDKALQAYQKLQLKFPEKRVYFAGRIKAVKEKLNS